MSEDTKQVTVDMNTIGLLGGLATQSAVFIKMLDAVGFDQARPVLTALFIITSDISKATGVPVDCKVHNEGLRRLVELIIGALGGNEEVRKIARRSPEELWSRMDSIMIDKVEGFKEQKSK